MSRKERQEKKPGDDTTLIEATIYEQKKKGAILFESHPMGVTGLERPNIKNVSTDTYEVKPKKRVHDRVHNPDFLSELAAKWESLTDAEKSIIMKLLK